MDLNRRHVAAALLAWFVVFGIFVALASPTEFVDSAMALSGPRLAAMVGLKLLGTVLMGLVLYSVSRGVGLDVALVESVFLNATVSFAKRLTPFGQASGIPVGGAVISQWTGDPFEEALAALSMKEFVGFVPSVLVFLVGGSYIVFFDPAVPDRVRSAVGVFTLGVGVFVFITVLVYRNPERARAILQRIAATLNRGVGRLPRVSKIDEDEIQRRVDGFAASIQRVTSDRSTVVTACTLRTGATLTKGALLWVTLAGVGVDMSLAVAVFVVPVSLLASAVPLPGGTGGVEGAQVLLVLGITGGDASAIITAVAVSRGLIFWTPVTIGTGTILGIQVKKRWRSRPS